MTSVESAYHRIHRTLDRLRLPAKYHNCAWCLRTASDWAYRWGTDPNEQHAGKRVWSENTSNYVAMCRSCHRKYDQAYRRVGIEGLEAECAPLIKAAYLAVDHEQRYTEATAREASALAAHRYLAARETLGRRYGKVSLEVERATHSRLVSAYAKRADSR